MIELLAPAGNLEKAQIALEYGADAVYVGGKKFSLRARASNFTIDDLEELAKFAHERNKKVYVTTNIIPHEDDLDGLDDYLLDLERIGINGIITSSMYIIKRAEKIAPKLERHVSTQTSVSNIEALRFLEKQNVKRVVLSRELSIDEITKITKETNLEIEVFIHGGMCSSYSGRCVLSNRFARRDANRGGCAHSCRWNYHLFNGDKKINKDDEFFNIGSKDLMAINFIPKLIDAGVRSLKIEGRMKSAYYLAVVVKSYRNIIDKYLKNGLLTNNDILEGIEEISKAENRLTSCGFLNGLPTPNEQLYDTRSEMPTQEYIAAAISYDNDKGMALVEERNYFEVGDLVEAFGPKMDNHIYTITKIIDYETGEELLAARHPLQKLLINCDVQLDKMDMIRKVK